MIFCILQINFPKEPTSVLNMLAKLHGITGSLAKYPGSTRLLYNCKKLGSDHISQSPSASSMVTLIHWDRFANLATSVSAHHTTSKRSNILKFCEMHLFMIKRNFPKRKSTLDQGGFRYNT